SSSGEPGSASLATSIMVRSPYGTIGFCRNGTLLCRVEHPLEDEAVCGGGGAGRRARPAAEEEREILRRAPPQTDFHQGSDQSTNHAAQEAVAHDPEAELLPRLAPIGGEDPPERLAVRAAGRGESREVVAAGEEGGRPGEPGEVDLRVDPD